MADVVLQWEWPNGRTPEFLLTVEVTKIRKKRAGLFGVGRSPSIVKAMPEPIEIFGMVRGVHFALQGKTFSLILPGPESAGLYVGGYAELGVLAEGRCISIEPVLRATID